MVMAMAVIMRTTVAVIVMGTSLLLREIVGTQQHGASHNIDCSVQGSMLNVMKDNFDTG